ncbi:hypothetical protein MTO96_004019 [Rhipicephalus appendiculatus]
MNETEERSEPSAAQSPTGAYPRIVTSVDTSTWAPTRPACASTAFDHNVVPFHGGLVAAKTTSGVTDAANRLPAKRRCVMNETEERSEPSAAQSPTVAYPRIVTSVDTSTWAPTRPACATTSFDHNVVPFHGGQVAAKTTSGVTDAANRLPAKRRCVMNETEEQSEPSAAQSPTGAYPRIVTSVDTSTWAPTRPACATTSFDHNVVPFHGGQVAAKTTSGVTDAANRLPAKRRCVMNETEEQSEPSPPKVQPVPIRAL